jgi:hypothetical protein
MPGGLEIEALKALVAHNQSWADWSTIAVFIGLLGEIAITFAYTKDKPRSEIVLGVVCGAVIAFGVYGEYKFGSNAAQENAELQNISDRKVAELNKEAGDARMAAGDAISEAGHANERASQANERAASNEKEAASLRKEASRLGKRAEDERLARVMIEEKIADRHLSIEQQRKIAAKLRRFAGTRLNLFAFSNGGDEVVKLGNELLRVLTGPNSAEWVVSPSLADEPGLVVPGIGIEVQQNADPRSIEAANALLSALTDERLSVGVIPAPPPGEHGMRAGRLNEDPKAMIRIIIGKKP